MDRSQKYMEKQFNEYDTCRICNGNFKIFLMCEYRVNRGCSWKHTHICRMCAHDNNIVRHPENNKKMYGITLSCNHYNDSMETIFGCRYRNNYLRLITENNIF